VEGETAAAARAAKEEQDEEEEEEEEETEDEELFIGKAVASGAVTGNLAVVFNDHRKAGGLLRTRTQPSLNLLFPSAYVVFSTRPEGKSCFDMARVLHDPPPRVPSLRGRGAARAAHTCIWRCHGTAAPRGNFWAGASTRPFLSSA